MGVKVTISGAIPRDVWDAAAMRATAERALASILARVHAGRGDDDRPLRRHADGTAADLVSSGRMLASLAVASVSETRATVELTGRAREYGPHTDGDRPWLGISPRDAQAVIEAAENAAADAMGRSRGSV